MPSGQVVDDNGRNNTGLKESTGGSEEIVKTYKLGDVLYARLESKINSDTASIAPEIFASVISYDDPLSGEILSGGFKNTEKGHIRLEFNRVSPDDGRTQSFTAVAISEEDMNTYVQGDVDNHTVFKWASAFGYGLMQGFGSIGDTIINSGSQITSNGFNTVETKDQLSTEDRKIVAASKGVNEVATFVEEGLQENMRVPPTITKEAGDIIGIVFLQDFELIKSK
jgi:hypothetical protein